MARCEAVSPIVRFPGSTPMTEGWQCDREAGHRRIHKAVRDTPPRRETTIKWHDETTTRSER